ncbi:hypothetical protein FGO68_gene9914 [Halteria grandinella]|uniref:Uncharacterized protein n=1 Tax=Halteria grandinella TaxID=5974 RepID=A0A8J8T8P9_HALGN|nr:hypothetical protein FGO68_gene9914 [Halteria grandinella]
MQRQFEQLKFTTILIGFQLKHSLSISTLRSYIIQILLEFLLNIEFVAELLQQLGRICLDLNYLELLIFSVFNLCFIHSFDQSHINIMVTAQAGPECLILLACLLAIQFKRKKKMRMTQG